jgi:redox-sensitive bicupin YhaK (pirin superfamily)
MVHPASCLHIMQAGSGMHHDEYPKTEGIETRGFQIWINHAERERMVAPRSIHVDAKEVPVIENEHALVRVIHGTYAGNSTPYQMVTPVDLLHVYLKPHKLIKIPVQDMAFVYGLEGIGNSGGAVIGARTLVNYSVEGSNVVVNAGKEGLQFMLGSGTPLKEPIIYGGPFVATTKEQMADMQHRYANNEMGVLI